MDKNIRAWLDGATDVFTSTDWNVWQKRVLLSGYAGNCFGYGLQADVDVYRDAMDAYNKIGDMRDKLPPVD